MSDSAIPWTIACQAPLPLGFPRQEYWTGLPFPSPGDLPDPGIESMSPALTGRFFTAEPPGKSRHINLQSKLCMQCEGLIGHIEANLRSLSQRFQDVDLGWAKSSETWMHGPYARVLLWKYSLAEKTEVLAISYYSEASKSHSHDLLKLHDWDDCSLC